MPEKKKSLKESRKIWPRVEIFELYKSIDKWQQIAFLES